MNPLTVQTPLWAYLAAVGFVVAVTWSWGWLGDRYELAGLRPVRRPHPPCSQCALHCPDGSTS